MIIKRNKILVVMPSRSRPTAMLDAALSITKNSAGFADVLVVVDADDKISCRLESDRISTQVMPKRLPMLRILDAAILPRLDQYDIFGFTGDDVIYRTQDWDVKVWNVLKRGIGIVYGDDGIQGENLPTHPWFSAGIVRATGYAAPPEIGHYYFDNYLKGIGKALDILHWRRDLITEHRHHSVNGLSYDNVYRQAERTFENDEAAFAQYKRTRLADDIAKVKAYIEIGEIIAVSAVIPPGSHTPIP